MIATDDAAINSYPNIGLRENTGITSDPIPKAGNASIYTSGCPKPQERGCHITGDPPVALTKKCASNCLSISIMNSDALSTGKAARIKNEFTTPIQTE